MAVRGNKYDKHEQNFKKQPLHNVFGLTFVKNSVPTKNLLSADVRGGKAMKI